MAIQFSRLIRADREFTEAMQTAKEQFAARNPLPIVINGLAGGAFPAFLAEAVGELAKDRGQAALILVGSVAEGEKTVSALTSCGLRAALYRNRDLNFYNITASHDLERERLSVLSDLTAGNLDCIVSTPSAALSVTLPPKMLSELSVRLSVGQEISPRALCEKLTALSFTRVDLVEGAGQFALRGGIVDFCRNLEEGGTRIEFFGDEVDRIVSFDILSQRAGEMLSETELFPATEVIVTAEGRESVRAAVASLLKKLPETEDAEAVKTGLMHEAAALESRLPLSFRDKYIGLLYPDCDCLLTYFSADRRPVFLLGTNDIREELKSGADALKEKTADLLSRGLVTKEAARYARPAEDFDAFLAKNVTFHINSFSGGIGSMKTAGLFGFRCRRTVSYGGNPGMLKTDLESFRRGYYRTLIVCPTKEGAKSLISVLFSDGIAAIPLFDKDDFDLTSAEGGQIFVAVGDAEGFDLILPKIALLSMAQDEGRAVMANRRRQRILRKVGGAGAKLMSYAELKPGDYVVHANYGIGIFEGIKTEKIDGIARDYITIRYAGTDELYVPCERLDVIGKYIGDRASDGTVKLSHMGGGDWQRTKNRAKAAAKDIAKDLIALYAERQRKPGFAFPPDSEMEREFADSFEFEETDSQLAAIEEITADMMKPVPMNRLLCGDVGFGKTEVALRAAFKAVVAGKQVAILVPTTILALQHFETALARMRGYAVTVEMISRLRSPKEMDSVLRRTKRGEVDILIGTHKILSSAVEFRDLGLVIVDEEQRFGVVQKEKLKTMAKNVDVLTLTATPIPRTLNMAMNGISDMSILDEAPGERRPVQTYVLEYDEILLVDAMKRELARGGQVFYLYNRVEDIDIVAGKIQRAIPEARVAYAHGQMDKDEIEDIWQMLVRAEIDILVSTTIIETGVDLPNANTLIIENADRMGLSQLHQIRGRVGRSGRQAYAYFTFRAGKVLSEVSEKRLAAIREFAEFGAGFKIALRDLEIRGAGNLLGAEQHGYIDSIGYELYVRLLNEAVLEEQGGAPKEIFEATVDLHADANIPESYISVAAQRMEMYKKISLIRTKADLDDITDEMLDRFGDMPRATERLMQVSLIRALASDGHISRVGIGEDSVTFAVEKIDLAVWSELFGKYDGLSFRSGNMPSVVYRSRRGQEKLMSDAIDMLDDYARIYKESEENRRENTEQK